MRVTLLVSGQVQGVGYRSFAARKARQLGLAGYAENLLDGRVEVVAEGSKEALEHYIAFLKQGPRLSRVTAVDVSWSHDTGLKTFFVH